MAAYDAALVLDRAIRLIDGAVNPASINRSLSGTDDVRQPARPVELQPAAFPAPTLVPARLRRDGGELANLTIQQVGTLS